MKRIDAPLQGCWRDVLYAGLLSLLASSSAISCAGEGLELVQTIKEGDGGAPLNGFIQSLTSQGDYLYVSMRHTGKLLYFKRDLTLGTLTYLGKFDGSWNAIYSFAAAGGRLYGVCGTPAHSLHGGESHGFRWFEINPKTGAPSEKGKLDIPIASEGGGLIASRDEKNLYVLLRTWDKVVRYRPDKDGTPVKVDEVEFKDVKTEGCCGLTLTADGKALYALCGGVSLACMEVKDDGSLVYQGQSSLKEIGSANAYGISPNGLYCYASHYNYYGKDFRLVLYSRDPKTNMVAFKENLTGQKIANMAQSGFCGYAFEPDGTTGYCLSQAECGPSGINWFTCNPKTGQLTFGGSVQVRGNTMFMHHDPVNGFLYVSTWVGNEIYVLKTGKKNTRGR